MRSYSYKEGIWKTCQDRLPPTEYYNVLSWGDGSEKYDRDKKYKDALSKAGFHHDGSKQYTCLLGNMIIHARNHETLPSSPPPKESDFDFLCVLRTSRTYIRIWIPDLPNLLLFMREVDAKPENDQAGEAIKHFLESNLLSEFLSHMGNMAESIWTGNGEITVKPEKPQKRI